MTNPPEPADCQRVALEGTVKYVGSRQRHILFCKCRPCREASAATRAPISTDPEVARRQEFLSTVGCGYARAHHEARGD